MGPVRLIGIGVAVLLFAGAGACGGNGAGDPGGSDALTASSPVPPAPTAPTAPPTSGADGWSEAPGAATTTPTTEVGDDVAAWTQRWSASDTARIEELLSSAPAVAERITPPCTHGEVVRWDEGGEVAELLVFYDPYSPPPGVPPDACGGDLVGYYFRLEGGQVVAFGAATESPGIFSEDEEALAAEQLQRYHGSPSVRLDFGEPTAESAVVITEATVGTYPSQR